MSTIRENVERDSPQMALGFVGRRLEREFGEHRREHPEVYTKLLVLARQAKERGFRRMGIARLFEIARWEAGPHERDRKGFALNNDLRAYYARALMADNDDLAGFFHTRELRNV